MNFKSILRKVLLKEKADSKSYVDYLRSMGVQIGENVTIFEPMNTCIDYTRPYLLEIGNNVKIARGVTILTHDFSWSVINGKYGEISGAAGKVSIGNNVFIGMQATILMGVTVGNNVIIGANSLVVNNIPDDCVVAGNPAKVICSLEKYREKRRAVQFTEAKKMALEYKNKVGEVPPKKIFSEFLWLFHEQKNPDGSLCDSDLEKILHINGNYNNTLKAYNSRNIMFQSYEEFLEACFSEHAEL